jgi:hypothetical protein
MANRNITITAVSGSTLTLSDRGQTNVDRGDTVTWIIDPGVDIEITSISVDPGSHDIFSSDPAQVGKSSSWRGTVASNASGEEDYTIHWQRKSNGKYYSMDPKLMVNN